MTAEQTLRISYVPPSVDRIILGTSSFGCLYSETSENDAKLCVTKAVELGIRYADTAPWYGAGLSESRLAQSLEGCQETILISTKCGRIIKDKDTITEADHEEQGYLGSEGGQFFTEQFHNNRPCWDYTASGIRESVRQSCERLQIDKIHCLRLHDAEDEERYAQAVAKGGAVETMLALQEEGKVTEVSLGMGSKDYILRFLKQFPNKFNNILVAGSFNLIDNDGIDVLLECQRQGTRVVNAGIFASGILRGGEHYRYASIPSWVTDKVAKWQELAEKHDVSIPQLAISFAFLPEIVEYVAVGCATADEVEQNIALMSNSVPIDVWHEAQAVGLIDERVQLPCPS